MRHTKLVPAPAADPLDDPLPGYEPVTLHRQRHDGWTAERQRTFLIALSETGCISEACRMAGMNPRSAYHLRRHPLGKRFAEAWDKALGYATARLMTIAYDRAIIGSVRETWRGGKLVGETRQPSDRLLMFLLTTMAPRPRNQWSDWSKRMEASGDAAADFASLLDELTDCPIACEPLHDADPANA
jgi:hypothetical protein